MKRSPLPNLFATTDPFKGIGGEKLLQFIGQFGYFNKTNLQAVSGQEITIIATGSLNKNEGPDFFNGRIKIGDTVLAGTIELHLKTSDWQKHRHGSDAHYNNVILHVVFQHDLAVNNIPVLELQPRISTLLLSTYAAFMQKPVGIPCGNSIGGVKELTWIGWKERLLAERLQRKSLKVLYLFEQSSNHWEETFWWVLAGAFGSKANGEAFEAIARSLPLTILAKHKASIQQLEALLLGQAGLLDEDFEEAYPKLLQREYRFLAGKYNLKPAAIPVLFLRMRPGNFPSVRLAQLAALIQSSTHLFSKIIEAENMALVKELFAVTANDFWHYHYTFHQPSAFKKKTLGADTIDSLIINTVVPVLFAYGWHKAVNSYKEKALQWLEILAPEANVIVKEFQQLGVPARSAYDTQSLIELRNEYCSLKKCLDCSVGNQILKEAAAGYALAPGRPLV